MKKYNFKRFKKIDIKENFKIIQMGIFLIFLILFLVYFTKTINESPLFRVQTVNASADLQSLLSGAVMNKSLFTIDTKKIAVYIEKNNPEYKDIRVIRDFPSSLKIEFNRRKPVAQILVDKFYLIDDLNIVISDGSTDAYPGLTIIQIDNCKQKVAKGSFVKDRRLGLAFSLLRELQRKGIPQKFPVPLVNATTPSLLYFIIENVKIIIGPGDFERKIFILENIISNRLHDNFSSLDYIDLRYKKSYLGFKK